MTPSQLALTKEEVPAPGDSPWVPLPLAKSLRREGGAATAWRPLLQPSACAELEKGGSQREGVKPTSKSTPTQLLAG